MPRRTSANNRFPARGKADHYRHARTSPAADLAEQTHTGSDEEFAISTHALLQAQGQVQTQAQTEAQLQDRARARDQAAHWRRLTAMVDAATACDARIELLQERANTQLGAAELRFNELLNELGDVMPLPIRPSTPGARLASLVRAQNAAPAEAIAA